MQMPGSLPTVDGTAAPNEQATVALSCDLISDLVRGRYRLRQSGMFWRPDAKKFCTGNCDVAFDGRLAKWLWPDAPQGHPTGFVDHHSMAIHLADLSPIIMALEPQNTRHSGFDLSLYDIDDQGAMIDDHRCVVLRSKPGKDVRQRREWWLDKDRSYLVLRYYAKNIDNGGVSKWDCQYAAMETGAVMPSRWTRLELSPSGDVAESTVCAVSTCALNTTVADADFSLDFPAGALVTDLVNKESYIMRDGGMKRAITNAETRRSVTYDDFLATESGMAGLEGQRLAWPRSTWALLGILVATAIALALWRRWIRRTSFDI